LLQCDTLRPRNLAQRATGLLRAHASRLAVRTSQARTLRARAMAHHPEHRAGMVLFEQKGEEGERCVGSMAPAAGARAALQGARAVLQRADTPSDAGCTRRRRRRSWRRG
jgi:hypothetical protein